MGIDFRVGRDQTSKILRVFHIGTGEPWSIHKSHFFGPVLLQHLRQRAGRFRDIASDPEDRSQGSELIRGGDAKYVSRKDLRGFSWRKAVTRRQLDERGEIGRAHV